MEKVSLVDIINRLSTTKFNHSNQNIDFITTTSFKFSHFFSVILQSSDYNFISSNYSPYYNIAYVFYNKLSNNLSNNYLNIIENFKNKLILDINNNNFFFKYITNKCKKNLLIQYIENDCINEFILQYIAESFGITIIVLDSEIDKLILFYNNVLLDVYNNFFILYKINDQYNLVFKDEQYLFNYTEINWLFSNLNHCIRCNLEFKDGIDVKLNKYVYTRINKSDIICNPNIKEELSENYDNKNRIESSQKLTNNDLKKYTLKQLQNIAIKSKIEITIPTINGKKNKNKTKLQLYNDINVL